MNTLIFYLFLSLGTTLTLTSSSWFMAWFGLEMNLLAFLPIISQKNKMSTEAMLKYFLTQTIGSILILLLTITLTNKYLLTTLSTQDLMTIPLALKLGAAPFHFWFPAVSQGLSWNNLLLLLTWQKIAPLFLMTMMNLTFSLIPFTIIMSSALIGAISGLNQTLSRKILTYSSIAHMSWLLTGTMISHNTMWVYFLLYSLMTSTTILILKLNNLVYLTQIMNNPTQNTFITSTLFMNLLSLGGMPPFVGFFPKWLMLKQILSSSNFTLTFSLISSSLITLYFYMRLAISNLMMNPSMTAWYIKSNSPSPLMKTLALIPLISLPMMILM